MDDSDIFEDDGSILDNYEDKIDINQDKLIDKTIQIEQLISHFEYRLAGFMWKSNGQKYEYVGNPLMGDSSIQKTMLLLHPFSREILLISNKNKLQWAKQLYMTRCAFNVLLVKSHDIDIEDFKALWRTFSNLTINIGDIISEKNSQKILEKYYNYEKDKDEAEDINI